MYNSMLLSIFGWDPFKGLKDFIWQMAILITVVVLIIAFIRWPNARIYIGVVFSVVAFGSAVICGLRLNTYYKAKGGIIGTISHWVNPTQVQIVSDTEFKFIGLEMRKINETTYRATTSSKDIVNLPIGSSYVLLVNGMPSNVKQEDTSSDYLIGAYTYTFYNENKQEIKTDTLTIRVVFNKLNTIISVSTNGGGECAELWNEFFNKNGFTITLTTDKYVEQNELDFGSGDVSNYHYISFNNSNDTFMYVVPNRTKLKEIPNVPASKQGAYVWTLNNEIVDFNTLLIEEDLTFELKYYEHIEGNYYFDFSFDEPLSNSTLRQYVFSVERASYGVTEGQIYVSFNKVNYGDNEDFGGYNTSVNEDGSYTYFSCSNYENLMSFDIRALFTGSTAKILDIYNFKVYNNTYIKPTKLHYNFYFNNTLLSSNSIDINFNEVENEEKSI